jgi:hypothetical protein
LSEEIEETFTDFMGIIELSLGGEGFAFPAISGITEGATLVRIRGIETLGGVVLFLDGTETCSGISEENREGILDRFLRILVFLMIGVRNLVFQGRFLYILDTFVRQH